MDLTLIHEGVKVSFLVARLFLRIVYNIIINVDN